MIANLTKPKFFRKDILLRSVLLAFIGLLYFGRAFNEQPEPYITGDGNEYILMTESFINHGTPELRIQDLEKFKARHTEDQLNQTGKRELIDALETEIKYVKPVFKDNHCGFFL